LPLRWGAGAKPLRVWPKGPQRFSASENQEARQSVFFFAKRKGKPIRGKFQRKPGRLSRPWFSLKRSEPQHFQSCVAAGQPRSAGGGAPRTAPAEPIPNDHFFKNKIQTRPKNRKKKVQFRLQKRGGKFFKRFFSGFFFRVERGCFFPKQAEIFPSDHLFIIRLLFGRSVGQSA